MKKIKLLPVFFMAFALLFLLGCTATPTQESTGEYIDDSVITARVKTALLNEPTLKSFEINVETYKGVVQLSGFVSPQSNWNKAVEIAHSIKGVRSVNNDMRSK